MQSLPAKLSAPLVLLACVAIFTSCDRTANSGKGPAKFPVRDFGAVPDDAQADGEAIRKCIAAAQASGKSAEVVFEAGTYQIEPGPAANGELVALPVQGAQNMTLQGMKNGSTKLVITNPSASGVLFEGCTNVAIKDLRLDYDLLPYASGTIASVDAKGGTFDLDLEDGSLAFDHPVFSPEKAKTVWGMTVRPDAIHGTTHYGPNIIGGGAKISPVEGRRWRLGSNLKEAAAVEELKPGTRLVHMARTYGYGVCFRNSTNVRAEGVTILASPGLAFLPILCGGEIAFVDCHVRVVPGRPLSTNADGIHARGLRGKLLIERCSFEGMADDAINIHSSAILVQSIVSPSEIIAPNHTWSLRPGDELVVMDPQTLAEKGRTTVASAEPGPGSTHIRFTKPIEGLKAGSTYADADRIYNLSEAGSPFVIRDCKFLSFRGRGILASSTGGIIERNRFENNEGWGIDLGFGERIWGEGPPPENIVIVDNEFIGKGGILPAINVRVTIDFVGTTQGPREADRGIRPFQNLTIRDNTFESLSAPAIRLGGVDGALVENNTIKRTGAAETLKSAAVEVDNSAGVVIRQLIVQDPHFTADLKLGSLLEAGDQGVKVESAGLRIVDQRK
jgi:polygalacturonase